MKNALKLLCRVVVAASGMLLFMELVNRVIFAAPSEGEGGGDDASLGLKFISYLLIVGAFAYPVIHSRLRGARMFGAAFLAYLGIAVFLTQIEAAVFLTLTTADVLKGALSGLLEALALASLLTLVFGKFRQSESGFQESDREGFGWKSWLGKFALCSAAYTTLYMIAGIMIYRYVSEFYATQDAPFTAGMNLPSTQDGGETAEMSMAPVLILPLQLFRGACYVGFILPLLRSMPVSRLQASLALAFLFPLIAGVATLLIPNSFMPDAVRHVHMFEIGWSNFVYGLLVGFVFTQGKQPLRSASETKGLRKRFAARLAAVGLRFGLLVVALLVCMTVAGQLSGLAETAGAEMSQEEIAKMGALSVIVCLVQALILAYPILRSRWHGLKLTGVVALVFFGIESFMSQIEVLIFNDTFNFTADLFGGMILSGVLKALFFAPLAVLILGKMRAPQEAEPSSDRLKLSWQSWLRRLGGLSVGYVCIYFLFGYFVAWQSEAVRLFYTGSSDIMPFFTHMRQEIAEGPSLIVYQLLRGLVWVALALPIIRMMKGRAWETSLAVGLLLGVLFTIGLLYPNPYMPEAVRLAHFIETSISNALFGFLIAWVMLRKGSENLASDNRKSAIETARIPV